VADDDDNLTGGEEPPEDDLPPTGEHDVLSGDGEEGESGSIPSFEEYRRAREEGRGGGWSPFGAGTEPGAGGEHEGEQEPVEGPPADEPGEGEAGDTLPVRGEHEDDGGGGETPDGDEALLTELKTLLRLYLAHQAAGS